jgi:AmiR/NasT family two-component response regulator
MKRENLSEQGAYKLIRKYSMDKRKNMKEVAEAILLNEEMRKFSSGKE